MTGKVYSVLNSIAWRVTDKVNCADNHSTPNYCVNGFGLPNTGNISLFFMRKDKVSSSRSEINRRRVTDKVNCRIENTLSARLFPTQIPMPQTQVMLFQNVSEACN